MTADVTGEIELNGKTLVIKRIHAHYKLRAADAAHDVQDVIERVHAMHADRCPVALSLKGAIEVGTSYELV